MNSFKDMCERISQSASLVKHVYNETSSTKKIKEYLSKATSFPVDSFRFYSAPEILIPSDTYTAMCVVGLPCKEAVDTRSPLNPSPNRLLLAPYDFCYNPKGGILTVKYQIADDDIAVDLNLEK